MEIKLLVEHVIYDVHIELVFSQLISIDSAPWTSILYPTSTLPKAAQVPYSTEFEQEDRADEQSQGLSRGIWAARSPEGFV
jgi:hypothetical protein